jgi:hypothetical protein
VNTLFILLVLTNQHLDFG